MNGALVGVLISIAGYYNAVVQILIAQGKTARPESFAYLQGGWSRTAQYWWAAAIAAGSTLILIISLT